jgi:hypothetical protein
MIAVKPIEPAQDHWRMVNAPHLVALARAGVAGLAARNSGRNSGRNSVAWPGTPG